MKIQVPAPARWPTGLFAASALSLLGCGGGGGGSSSTAPPPPPAANTIQVGPGGAMSFSPASLTVDAGTTVTWTWGSPGHSVTSGTGCVPDGTFDSSIQGAGYVFTHAFTTPGTYGYFCTPHCSMGMAGTVVVNAVAMTVMVGQGQPVFSPANLTIRAGQTVTWQWAGSGVSLDSGSPSTPDNQFSSHGQQGSGFTLTHTFSRPGTYTYFTAAQPGQAGTGTITVNP